MNLWKIQKKFQKTLTERPLLCSVDNDCGFVDGGVSTTVANNNVDSCLSVREEIFRCPLQFPFHPSASGSLFIAPLRSKILSLKT